MSRLCLAPPFEAARAGTSCTKCVRTACSTAHSHLQHHVCTRVCTPGHRALQLTSRSSHVDQKIGSYQAVRITHNLGFLVVFFFFLFFFPVDHCGYRKERVISSRRDLATNCRRRGVFVVVLCICLYINMFVCFTKLSVR